MLVMVVFFIAFRWIHLSTPLIRLFLLVLILLLMPTLNFLPVWFALRLSLQTHNVNRCGRSRHLARKLGLRRKRSSPNVFEMRSEERRVGKECRSRWSADQ